MKAVGKRFASIAGCDFDMFDACGFYFQCYVRQPLNPINILIIHHFFSQLDFSIKNKNIIFSSKKHFPTPF
jgi:hypothetical protein